MTNPQPHMNRTDNDQSQVSALVQMVTDVGMGKLIANLTSDIRSIAVGSLHFPMTISDEFERPNCYICCPSVAYVDYAVEEMRNFEAHPALKSVLNGLVRVCAPLVWKAGLDHQVQPNNWLLSTNPVPTLLPQDARQLKDQLVTDYPDRAIVIRSLNTLADGDTIRALRQAGFIMLPARQVYIFDPATTQKQGRDEKRDQQLIQTTAYETVSAADFDEADFRRAEDLYNLLYLQKYTPLNPHYTAEYLRQSHERGLLEILGLRGPNGQLDGVLGLFENGKTLTAPVVGYDTSLPQHLGLYRLLMALAQDRARTHGKYYNMSAGTSAFKRNRGAVPAIEYTAVFVSHLEWKNRLATRVAKFLLDVIGVPLLRRFEL